MKKVLKDKDILKIAKKVVKTEAKEILAQSNNLDENFCLAVKMLAELKGKVVVLGIGKSGLIGRKIAATFSSLGIPSVFLHPVELLHGDLGLIRQEDIVLILSYSGETEEIKKVLPIIRSFGIKIIALTGKKNSKVASSSDVVINTKITKEACPYNIVPTSSTTAMLVIGDALGITVARVKGFKKEDFAKFHPSGSLGKQLTLKVKDVMRKGKLIPKVSPDTKLREALFVMTSCKLGATCVVDENDKIIGYFTDGDLRRLFQKGENVLDKKICEIMTKNPKVIRYDELVVVAKELLKKYNCDNLPVVNEEGKIVGIIDERDILQEGI